MGWKAGLKMTDEEYNQKRREIIEWYSDEIDGHENAGCYDGAENARKWMATKLKWLEEEHRGGVRK